METKLPRFACTYCRQKKLKCSRELPKCSNCRPWPSGCEYSREKSSSAQPTPIQTSNHITGDLPVVSDIEGRLKRLEHTVQQLTDSVNRAVQVITSIPPPANTGTSSWNSRSIFTENVDSESRPYVGPSHSFSFLKEASANVDAIRQSLGELNSQSAHSELQYLSGRLTTAEGDQQIIEDSTAFYIPSKATGYRMISSNISFLRGDRLTLTFGIKLEFLEYDELGEPFFSFPPDNVIREVVFEPHKVREKAWVAYFNHMMLSIVSNENGENGETKKFRRNVQLALRDSSIFLKPSYANVQALCFLAMHGEDYTAPNLSWMLLGHACRQAEALGLHSPAHQDVNLRQQRLCLFWLLFLIDKSCSLSFGRPAFLPTALYQNVSLPDQSLLLRFNPHERAGFGGGNVPTSGSRFGAEIITRSIQWAKLGGSVAELLAMDGSVHRKQEVRSSLGTWWLDTHESLTSILHVESASATASQIREMNLGISTMRFQYLHSLILLLEGDGSSPFLRLSSAREAISTLSSMVSNWSSVYNGVVWQLLYCPFTPFFVIFGNIIHSDGTQTSTIPQDLKLLSATVDYFAAMRLQMRLLATVCSRLQHTASVFLQLAQVHVSRHALTETIGKPDEPFQSRSEEHIDGHYQDPGELTDLHLGELNVDNYLKWLPTEMSPPWSMFDADQPGVSCSRFSNTRSIPDNMFDWFSWDTYYGDRDII